MPKRQKLIIDREEWLRGDEDHSMLLDNEGKRCCVGIYLKSCGVDDEVMLYTPDVESLVELHHEILPEPARWMFGEDGDVPKLIDLYKDNDSGELGDCEREQVITEKFAAYGVEVSFVN